jgi:hypothetical protein
VTLTGLGQRLMALSKRIVPSRPTGKDVAGHARRNSQPSARTSIVADQADYEALKIGLDAIAGLDEVVAGGKKDDACG